MNGFLGFPEPASVSCRRRSALEPRSGDRYLAWGVSPRFKSARKRPSREAATDVRALMPAAHAAGENLSPLQGSPIFPNHPDPGAHAPGYECVAPSELAVVGFPTTDGSMSGIEGIAWCVETLRSAGFGLFQPRSGDRHLAWGVSPRIRASDNMTSREAAADSERGALAPASGRRNRP